jgi:hypothetical protein
LRIADAMSGLSGDARCFFSAFPLIHPLDALPQLRLGQAAPVPLVIKSGAALRVQVLGLADP